MNIFLVFLLLFISVTAQARIYIPIDQPSDKKFPIAICNLDGGGKFGREVADVIRSDLTLSGYFYVLPFNTYEARCDEDGTDLASIRFDVWKAMETQALVKGKIEKIGSEFALHLSLFDPHGPSVLVEKQFQEKNDDMRHAAHKFSDDIMEALTGIRGVFTTKIAYASATNKQNKEILVMDMDGQNARKVTKLKTISLSPSWSPKGDQLVFSSYKDGRPNLYVIGRDGKNMDRLTTSSGISISPTWSPVANTILFAASGQGEVDLYRISTNGRRATAITNASGIDLAPDFSPDGSEVVFASERAGKLHIFKMPASGGEATRLTYVGYQNDMPSWSPMGDKIAFAGRDLGTFDIFIMNPDGSNIQRLTIRSGSNESPSFSPDGRFIVFSSTRDGGSGIYLMRADGSNQTRISDGHGMLPDWGPRND
ncbi:MAG: Tol-Pal system beta propeller repeat protein TolB [Deltaproteobacteria bacterium]|nr:Tol-Pal system beta propeller repeat protein TolB [Deltaproteobacteria bacterium]